ncbi:shikimate dehydrogenase family protein [Thioclava pacifica]|uniref:Shikimate dehydrogenase substrate binding N-terminal domain-containing protein n=1 Tax=Thioclava pacifica DSM 10166 TaxID=1353537 RepID=A0A074JCN8_9RHOB|nr:shikimate dehydrogenase [Thioclava pacifica]KEO55416.1 hypothetical protein TP2_15355 [Thioclava pacifica DSM 10166]
MISGKTRLIAHLGYPTENFRAPMIYNPYFEKYGIDAVVMPMGCKPEDFEAFFPLVFKLSNIHGALITMPHKVSVLGLLDEISTTAQVAGSCNAVRLTPEGKLIGDQFDGEAFVRGLIRKGLVLKGARAYLSGCGGAGAAIAASLAKAGIAEIALQNRSPARMEALAERLASAYPALDVIIGHDHPAGFDLVVNASPLGAKAGDPLPIDVDLISAESFVGEVVMSAEITPFLAAAQEKGCRYQVGSDMLLEQIPAYLEFFEFRSATPEEVREVARITY